MINLTTFFTLIIILCSCQRNPKHTDTFYEAKAEEMVISYDDSTRITQGPIDTVITNPQEIQQMKSWIRQSIKSDTSCERWTGAISFRNSKDSAVNLGISDVCPSAFYHYVGGKAQVFIMSQECETYLKKIMKNSLQ